MSPQQAAALVQPLQVHRDIYLSEAVFALEMRRIWARSWLYVAHESQVIEAGSYLTLTLAAQPLVLLRRHDGALSLLHNRCAHKGAPLYTAPSGNTGPTLRCPYHGWSYRQDGRLLSQPLKHDYTGSGFEACPAQQGLAPYGELATHRGFIFARAQRPPGGEDFTASMGELLPMLDLLADRSPQGQLRVAGGVLRTRFAANWKIYLENIVDAVHPVTTHASVTTSAQAASTSLQVEGSAGAPAAPLALRQLLPFGAGYSFFEQMGARLLPQGHSVLGTRHSIHTGYAALGNYGQALAAAHGAERAEAVLAFAPQNIVFYPSMALKGAPSVMRVLRPISAGVTELEAWAFEPEGAPPELLANALLYNRQVFSPLSMVAHDDLHLFEGLQRSLASHANPWVNLCRGAAGDAAAQLLTRDVSGTDEALMRHGYAHWARLMLAGDDGTVVQPPTPSA